MIDYTGVVEASVITPTLIIALVASVLGIKEMSFSDLTMLSVLPLTPFFVASILGVLEMWQSVISLGIGFICMSVFLVWVSGIIDKQRRRTRGSPAT